MRREVPGHSPRAARAAVKKRDFERESPAITMWNTRRKLRWERLYQSAARTIDGENLHISANKQSLAPKQLSYRGGYRYRGPKIKKVSNQI